VSHSILIISDLHYGKKTSTFDTTVALSRLTRAVETLPKRNPSTILLLGDIIDGSNIYKTQAAHQEVVSAERQAQEVALYFSNLIKQRRVKCYAVAGNHGRSQSLSERDNWDIVFYRYVEKEANTKLLSDCEDEFLIRKVDIAGKSFLISHGGEFTAYSGSVPWFAYINRATRWKASYRDLTHVVIGHFHTSGIIEIGNLTLMTNGTAVSDDVWALRRFGYVSLPGWWRIDVQNNAELSYRLVSLDRD